MQGSCRIVIKGLCHEIFGKTVPTIMRNLTCDKITDLCISVKRLNLSVRSTSTRLCNSLIVKGASLVVEEGRFGREKSFMCAKEKT